MGLLVLGILIGWLAEWLFFTFWVKGGSNNDSSECEELRVALIAKNKEITALKAEATKKTTNKAESVASLVKSTAPAKKTKTTKKAAPAKKPVAKKAPAKKATPKKAVTKKSAPAKKNAPAKKPTAVKATAAKKSKTAKKSTSGDDLTKLSGIGPSMAATMGELGITTYKKLAAMDDDILRDMLEASGARLNNNKEAMDSWNEQALLADKGDFAGLKKLQEEVKG